MSQPLRFPLAVLSALLALAATLSLTAASFAQQRLAIQNADPVRVVAHKAALQKLVEASNRLSPQVRQHLSRSLQNYLRFAAAAVNPSASPRPFRPENFSAAKNPHTVWQPWNLIPVSNVALDPASQGYTQNTTSTAWCGNAVVVGYEDSGAFLRSDPSQAFGVPVTLNGVSFSANAGKTFTDVGFLTPGSFFANALLGDPSLTCTSASHFQYASILNTTTPDGINPLIGPSISFSTDGGKLWSEPTMAFALDGNTQLADSPWLAVDPGDPRRLYLSYTSIDFLACNSINVLRSSDGGKTWSGPEIIDSQCAPTDPTATQNAVTGSRVIVAEDGQVHVVYEFFPGSSPNAPQINSIRIANSANHGATFSKPLRIADLLSSGTGVELTGHLLVNEYPQIAVDRSPGHARGTIYLAYPDGRHHTVADATAASRIYAYPDIFVAKSTNAGKSFAVLGAISPVPANFRGLGRDQFLPGIAVDKDGELAVCYYDRKDDRADLRVDRFCSVSSTQGKTWQARQASDLNWLPSQNRDPLNPGAGYAISEYDALTTDFLRRDDGFFGAFVIEISGNQNVVATKF